MNKLIENLTTYLDETLNMAVEIYPYENQKKMPFFLSNAYAFFEITLFKQPCLLMIAKDSKDSTPGMIRKNLEQVENYWEGTIIIYVQSILSSFNRKRLIEHHVPFIIPGNQMYLPHFGIDLREHFRKIHSKKQKSFSPGTQAAVIYVLLCEANEKLTPSILADKLGYTTMTMTRAFEELQAAEIIQSHKEGRERFWICSAKQNLWLQVRPFLRSPIKKRVWLKKYHFKTLAGLSALSKTTLLASPRIPIYAIGFNQWENIKSTVIDELPTSEEANLELEIWNYDPELFAKHGMVDLFSLYLSLEATDDERISIALDEMMEKIKW